MERRSDQNGPANPRRCGSFRVHLHGNAESVLHRNRLAVLQISHHSTKRVTIELHNAGRGQPGAILQLAFARLRRGFVDESNSATIVPNRNATTAADSQFATGNG